MTETPGDLRLVVLVSGEGTNLSAIIGAIDSGSLNVEIVAVVANRAGAGGLDRARTAGIEAHEMPRADGESRYDYERRLSSLLTTLKPDLVVMAGWMALMGDEFCAAFPLINLHPALPGMFPGLRAIERAYREWTEGAIKESGVMIHWVPDSGVDDGPVIKSVRVPFIEGDSLDSFTERTHRAEHELIVSAIGLLAKQPSLIKESLV